MQKAYTLGLHDEPVNCLTPGIGRVTKPWAPDRPIAKACAPDDGRDDDESAPLEHADSARPAASAALAQRKLKRMS
jgi:hypothetical protein